MQTRKKKSKEVEDTRMQSHHEPHPAPTRASLVAQMVTNLPAMQQTWVQSLGWEHPLKRGMATHSSILAWRIP